MGAIRGILLVFVSVLFFATLLVGNTLLTLFLSMDLDSIQEKVGVDLIDSIAGDIDVTEAIDESIPEMKEVCNGKTEFSFEDPNSGQAFTIPCDVINQGSEAILEYGIDRYVEEIYNTEYDCEFTECFEQTGNFYFLVSEKTKNWLSSKFYLSLTGSIILFALMFLLAEKKSNAFILSGILVIISSLPFIKLEGLLAVLATNEYLEIVTVFFNKASTVFLMVLITGIVLLAMGILMKLLGIGVLISSFFSKNSKKVSKDKMKKISKEVKLVEKKEAPKKDISKDLNIKKSK
jgi:hypothetical protein